MCRRACIGDVGEGDGERLRARGSHIPVSGAGPPRRCVCGARGDASVRRSARPAVNASRAAGVSAFRAERGPGCVVTGTSRAARGSARGDAAASRVGGVGRDMGGVACPERCAGVTVPGQAIAGMQKEAAWWW